MQRYYMLFRDNVIYVKTDANDKTVEYSLDNLTTYPNVPFYHYIFDDEKIIKELNLSIKNILNNGSNFKQLLLGSMAFIIMPDDVTDIERRALDELGKMLGFKEVILASECALTASYEEQNFISISRTCRMTILTYMKNKCVYKQKFIENKNYTSKELLSAVRELNDGFDVTPNIYLNGTHLSEYRDIGTVVDSPELLEKIKIVSHTVDFKKEFRKIKK